MDQRDRRALWRKQLGEGLRKLRALLDSLESHHPSFAGSLYLLKTRCGKPRCLCRQGDLHSAWCVSFVHQGRRSTRSIPLRFLAKLEAMAARYRRRRTVRSHLAKTFAALLRAFDRLERSLRVAPSRALPRPKARRRR